MYALHDDVRRLVMRDFVFRTILKKVKHKDVQRLLEIGNNVHIYVYLSIHLSINLFFIYVYLYVCL